MRLINPLCRIPCPFCGSKFHLSQAARRHARRGARTEPDEKLGAFLGDPNGAIDMPVVKHDDPSNRFRDLPIALLNRCVVFEDDTGEWKKVCPHCHMQLPAKTANGELSSVVIAVIGAANSGKSTFIAVLLKLLRDRYAREVGFRIAEQETFSFDQRGLIGSWEVFTRRYGAALFDQGEVLPANDPVEQHGANEIRIPLIFRFEFPKQFQHYLTEPLASVRALDLFIFDAAGEDMNDMRVMEWCYPYILAAKGIMFVIDPTTFPAVHRQLPPDLQRSLGFTRQKPADIIDSIIQLHEERTRVRAGRSIKVPAAFVLTKSDTLSHCVDRTSLILRDSQHRGGFDHDGCARVSDEVMSHIEQWNQADLIQRARRFKKSSFFAVSALGRQPDPAQPIHNIQSRRVADPLLWILWKLGYVRALPEE
jgi:GTPase SAR1 family protein